MNETHSSSNVTDNGTTGISGNVTDQLWLRAIFITLYVIIFILGVGGNFLVIFVVVRNKAMQTITNIFITNLAASDIMLCVFAVPFTPLAVFLKSWIFGDILCHIVPMILCIGVFVSTLTSIAIAVDRYFVIVHPFKPRIKVWLCIMLICGIWVISISTSLPLGIYSKVTLDNYTMSHNCEETFPGKASRRFFTVMILMLQYIAPCAIITYCYTAVSLALRKRSQMKLGSRCREREELEIRRKKRTNRMLIAMVAIFVICWLPLNFYHLINDFHRREELEKFEYMLLIFLIVHIIAMSSIIYNPFLYAFMNDNFRKEFNQIVPCLFRGVEARGKKNGTGQGSTYTAIETQNSFLNRSPSKDFPATNGAQQNNGESSNSIKSSGVSYDADSEKVQLHVPENGEC